VWAYSPQTEQFGHTRQSKWTAYFCALRSHRGHRRAQAKFDCLAHTSGIGAAVARLAVAAGAEVTTASRREEATPTKSAVIHLRLDISDEAQVSACLSGQRPFDHLIVTAGGSRAARFRDKSTETAMQSFETKFWGA
jgi:NADPH:quinone reductase-like Zn-dependent oxidoreductase